jgi:hypothetical protein
MTSRSTRHFTIRAVLTINAAPRQAAAIAAADDLLAKQRIEHLCLGGVARAAWLGGVVDSGSIDVLGLMQPQQKSNVAMMAGNCGFSVDRDEVERTGELDLVPLAFDGVRVHVLVASNALYARMFATARPAQCGERELRVPAAEDLALLLTMSEDEDAVRRLAAMPEFDRALYNEKLISIGLGALVV